MCFRQHCAILWLVYILSISSLVVGGRATLLKFVRFHQREFNRHHVDPEVHMNVTELITSKGFPCEDYVVQTQDGFLLSVQRIPHGRGHPRSHAQPRPVVFLQHGLLCSSTNWVSNLENESLAFILAEAGYDVWLGNMRGNTYSRKHVKLSPDQDQFWSWSFDEMAKYDLPAMLNFALNKSGAAELYYIGHSQGTMIAFAQFSQDQELAKKVKMFFALAPVTTVGDIISPLRYFAYLTPEITTLFKLLGVRDFLPNDQILKFLATTVCKDKWTQALCSNVVFLFSGYDPKQLNMTRLPVYLSHTPAGTSVQNMVHFAQLVRSGRFQMYDYGSPVQNVKHYGQEFPPLYQVEKMQTPTVIFWGDNDWLADPKDVRKLIPRVRKLVDCIEVQSYDHLDFIWAMNANTVIYDKIIQILNQDQH